MQDFVTLELLLAPNDFLTMGLNKFDCVIPEMSTRCIVFEMQAVAVVNGFSFSGGL